MDINIRLKMCNSLMYNKNVTPHDAPVTHYMLKTLVIIYNDKNT